MTLAQQRRYDTLAAGLLFFGSLVATIFNYFTNLGFWRPTLTHNGLIFLILFQPFYLAWVYFIWKGKRWAKILFVGFSALNFLALIFLPTPAELLALPPISKINLTAQNALSLSVFILLILSLRQPISEAP